MTNPANTPSTSIEKSAEQTFSIPDVDDKSISSQQPTRKRDKIRKWFLSADLKVKGESQPAKPETKKAHQAVIASTEARNNIRHADYSLKNSSLEARTEITSGTTKARINIFSENENVNRSATSIAIPQPGARIGTTLQLALCSSLLPKNPALSPQSEVLEAVSDKEIEGLQDMPTTTAHRDWVKAVEQNPIEQDHIRWLVTRTVEEFVKDEVKGAAAIAEIILLGPVLDREHYRKLLSCIVTKFQESVILDVDLLYGLVQLVQCASQGFLDADDLVKIMSILRTRLEGTHQQSTEHPYHLTLAVSRLLDVMADHKVHDINRVQEHEPLSAVLSGLKGSSDPFLMYQASYAFQAVQYVPNDETALQAFLRHSTAVANGLIKISGAAKLDLGSAVDGLKGLEETLISTFDIARSSYESVCSLVESGRGVIDSLKQGLGSGYKRPWYPALRAADSFVRKGQLAVLNQWVVEVPCRRDPLFQWGICQLLGEIAADETRTVTTRQESIDLLVDLYRNDMDWARDESVKAWMVAILEQFGKTTDTAIRGHAITALDDIKKDGGSTTSLCYPLRACLPIPKSWPLLNRVHNIPYVEYDLHQLKLRRLAEGLQSIYIPPMAKSSPQDRENDLFPLMELVSEFLANDRQVMLILGDSGAGKSTFNRHLECRLWREYNSGGKIPLFINLPAIDRPEKELIAEQLKEYSFSEAQIQELKMHRQFIVICDGYDESQLTTNLHTTNLLNRPGQWNVKLVISCRSQYLGQDYRDRFVPQGSGHYSSPALHMFQEAVIAPFSRSQIESYVEQYVPLEPRSWRTEDYMEKLTCIPNLMDLVTNPFLLTLSLGALPSVVQGKEDVSAVRITRVSLYDKFVEHWISANKRRLQNQRLEQDSQKVFAELVDDDFERNGIKFQKDLAAVIFQEQDGKPFVDYTHKRDKSSWKATFFSPEPEPTLLRGCSLLNRVGNQYRFIHRSVLEYFYSRFVYEPNKNNNDSALSAGFVAATIPLAIAGHPLTQRSLVREHSIIQFLCERVRGCPGFKQHLLTIIEQSKTDPGASQAAANAITILVRAGVPFIRADLRGIQIPGADLSGGQFDSAQLQGADLTNTNLRNIWLGQADLSNAQMAGAQFGELPYLSEDSEVASCAYSPDGTTFSVGLASGKVSVYVTATWEKIHTLTGHTGMVESLVYSPSGQEIASGSWDYTVRLWDIETGEPGPTLSGHTDRANSVVYSPTGQHIASGGGDNMVRLWDAQTGEPGRILSGHTDNVSRVVYSPTGQQIASGSWDNTVRLWDAQTGEPGPIISSHTGAVYSVVYSPTGQQIASGSWDNTVRLWDAQTGEPGLILSGHTATVSSVVYSPTGHQIASGSLDNTVRLWDAQTGEPGPILSGHTATVSSVVYSPTGQQVASGSWDSTVRLWDAQTDKQGPISSGGHIGNVNRVVYSPSGQQIASGSWDNTVRLWDTQIGESGPILSGHTNGVYSVVYSPTGQQVASGSWDNTVRLWDAQTGEPGLILSGHTATVSSVVYSPTGHQIASGSLDNTVRLWDAQTGEPGPILLGHTDGVYSVVYSPTGHQIASGSDDNTVRLWDAQSGEPGPILSGHTSSINNVVYSPNGQQIASGSDEDTVWLWDAHTGEPGPILSGHTGMVISVVYSPSGQQIASGSFDSTVRLWDAQTGEPGLILSGHTGSVSNVVYSPTGHHIASGSSDHTVRLWDATSGRLLALVKDFYGPLTHIVWNTGSNGHYFAAGCGDKTVRMWKVMEEGAQVHVHLHWSSSHASLCVSDTNVHNAQGLSKINIKLLDQRGALGEPIAP